MDKEFDEKHITTLGLDFATKKYKSKDGKEVSVKIWDTAGQERFKTLTYAFYKRADGVIVAFDMTEQESFKNVTGWMESISQNADDGIAKILVGNKVDLEDSRVVPREKAESLASSYGINYYETSAKANINIEECLEDIIEQSIKKKFNQQLLASEYSQ